MNEWKHLFTKDVPPCWGPNHGPLQKNLFKLYRLLFHKKMNPQGHEASEGLKVTSGINPNTILATFILK